MKLHLHEFGERNVIKQCRDGVITINDTNFTSSVIVTPQQIVDDWRPETIEELTADDLGSVAQLGVDLLILGTGTRQVFPPVPTLKLLVDASVGYEIMDSAAAARTYNILASEGRNVAAAILLQ